MEEFHLNPEKIAFLVDSCADLEERHRQGRPIYMVPLRISCVDGEFRDGEDISATQLNVAPEQLMERFVRGDESRTTEGSGLGLSIARSLTELQDGTFRVEVDGDLFKAVVSFPEMK